MWSASNAAQRPDEGGSSILPKKGFLFFAGDLSSEKGVPTLLRAYGLLGVDRPPLVLVGRRTPDTPVRLPNGAEIHPEWPHEQILAAFRSSIAAVLPSVWPDPCPTTVLEAMASGRPVVTTSVGGIIDMVTDGESGLLVHPGDERALAAAIKRVLSDSDLRSRLGAGAQKRAKAFTASAVAEQLESVYARVARRTPMAATVAVRAGELAHDQISVIGKRDGGDCQRERRTRRLPSHCASSWCARVIRQIPVGSDTHLRSRHDGSPGSRVRCDGAGH